MRHNFKQVSTATHFCGSFQVEDIGYFIRNGLCNRGKSFFVTLTGTRLPMANSASVALLLTMKENFDPNRPGYHGKQRCSMNMMQSTQSGYTSRSRPSSPVPSSLLSQCSAAIYLFRATVVTRFKSQSSRAHYPQLFRTRKSHGVPISREADAAACQTMGNRPPRDFCVTLWIIRFSERSPSHPPPRPRGCYCS